MSAVCLPSATRPQRHRHAEYSVSILLSFPTTQLNSLSPCSFAVKMSYILQEKIDFLHFLGLLIAGSCQTFHLFGYPSSPYLLQHY